MTSHNKTTQPKKARRVKGKTRSRFFGMRWHQLKGVLISRFETVEAAALQADCHPNSFREATNGKCPRVIGWLERNLPK